MPIAVKTWSDIVTSAVNAVASKAAVPLDMSPGSVVRAILEAATIQDLYLQSLIQQVQTASRAGTAQGADLDSYFADFSFTRLAAVAATGQVTFSRQTANSTAPVIPVGALVSAPASGIQFAVIADTNPALAPPSTAPTLTSQSIPQLATPAAPVLTTATAGGNIAAGTYWAKITYLNSIGETDASPESSSLATTGTTSTITVTGGALPAGATAIKVYLTPTAFSASGTEVFAGSYTSGTSLVLTALPAAGAAIPPSSNTTGGTIGAGTYYARCTSTNAQGETTPGLESAGLLLAGTTNVITINGGTLPGGATSVKVYIVPTGNSGPGAEVYAGAYTTGSSLTIRTLPPTTNAAPPTANTAANSTYSAALGGYVLPANVASTIAYVQATTAGTAGNVIAGAINRIVSSIAGVDAVTNLAAFTNGKAAESDSAYRTRFIAYLNSLSKATKAAIDAAIGAVQAGLIWKTYENQVFSGGALVAQNGTFAVIAQDGSGSLPAATQQAISNAVDAVRPFTVAFGVNAPATIAINVSMTAVIAAGYDATTVRAAIQAAVTSYLNTLAIGATAYYFKVAEVAIDASGGVATIEGLLLNGAALDVAIGAAQTARGGTVTVN